MTRLLKRWVCRTLIGAMLFAQMAVAAYACPGLSSALEQAGQGPAAAAEMSMVMAAADDRQAAMPNGVPAAEQSMDCEQMAAMDPELPNLCAQHCEQGHQSDQAPTLTVPTVLLATLYALAPPSEAVPVLPAPGVQPGVLVAAFPPHSILHCCLRD